MKIHFQEGDYYIIKENEQIIADIERTVINYSIENCILNVRRSWENRWERNLPQILHDDNGFTWTFSTTNDRKINLTITKDGEYYTTINGDMWNNRSIGTYTINQFYYLTFDRYEDDYAILNIYYAVPFDYNSRGGNNYFVQYYEGYNGAVNETYETGVSNLLLPRYKFGKVNNIVSGSPFTSITGVWKVQTDLQPPWSIGSGLLSKSGYTQGTIKVPKELIIPDSTDPYGDGGTSEPGGGTGDFDGTSDPIDFPSLPTLSAVDTGFITLFNPTLAELQNLSSYMWDGSLFDLSTWQKLFADPMDAILGLSIVPVSVPDGGVYPVKVGNIATPINMNRAASQYVEIDCGTLNINEYWGAYLDYSPYTKAEIYLPFCGIHAIDIDDVMSKSVHVKYHVDILSGACAAYVKCGDSVLYQFIGQCSSSIPISGTDFTQMINGVLSAAVSVGSMVATGGASAPVAIPSLVNTAANGGLKPSIEKSGAISGTGGMLSIQKPYIILTRPKQALPANQNHFTGYPSFVTESLGDLSGYTEIEKIHLEGIPATDEELSEIETLLKGGVIL